MNYMFSFKKLRFLKIILPFLTLLPSTLPAQITEDRVKAALIYNFASHVEWANERSISTFRIGLLDSDSLLFLELNNLSKIVKIKNRPIKVVMINEFEPVNNFQIFYLGQDHCGLISDFYTRITGQNTLLVTDKCASQLFVMINILYDIKTQTLSYEINRQNIENEGFKLNPEILVHGGSYVDIKNLYVETYNQLRIENHKIMEIQSMLEALMLEKDSVQQQASLLSEQIDELSRSKQIVEHDYRVLSQDLMLKDSLLLVRSMELSRYMNQSRLLEEKISNQLGMLNQAKEDLLLLNEQIEQKQLELDEQQKRIALQNEVLTEKDTIIDVQKRLIWVSVALAFSLFLLLFLIFRAYRSKKQMNAKLEKLVDIRTNELQLSREHFKNLFESSPVSICDMNFSVFYSFLKDQGDTSEDTFNTLQSNPQLIAQAIKLIKVNDVNSATLRLFGFDTKKGFIDNYFNTFNDKSISDFKETIINYLLKRSNYTYETVRLTSSNELKYLQISWLSLPGFKEDYSRVIVTMTDITELKKHRDHLEELVNERSEKIIHLNRELTDTVEELENTVHKLQEAQEQLIRAEKLASLGMLTAGIAHEINNPVNYISGSVQALTPLLSQVWEMLRAFDDKTVNVDELSSSIQFLLENIETGIRRTTEIISSLVSYSRTGEQVLSNFNVETGIKDALVILRSKYQSRIKMIEKYDRVPTIRCNPTSINQMIMNLLTNAIDSIPDTGTITISVTYSKFSNEMIMSVRDTGVGIPSDKMLKIFDPFFTTKDVGKGTGLGLYITYGIVQQHGGRIEVNSTENEGSEFVVYLPVKADIN